MAKQYRTRDCDCKAEMWPGQSRPDRCKHNNRFQTEAELKPRQGTQLAKVSPKRQAEEESGARPKQQRRRSGPKQGRGFQASKAQRDKVRLLPCMACGHGDDGFGFEEETGVDPAHLWPRGKGGCDHPDCVIPLCRTCHRLFDEGKLELLERLAGTEAWAKEQAHPILAHGVSPVELVRRLSGGSYEFVKRSDLQPPPTNKGSVAAPRGAA